MDSKSLVTRIAFLIIGISLLDLILHVAILGGRGLMGNIVGLVINAALAMFLISGENWARWFMAIRCGFGAILSITAWIQLGHLDYSFFSIIRLWLLLVAIFSAAIGAYLLLSKRVNEHFSPGTGF